MAYATVNGKGVFSAQLIVPRVGAWRLDAIVDAEGTDGLTQAIELSLNEGASIWRGRAWRVADNFGRVELRAVGGGGGLSAVLSGQSYRQATARAILTDILEAAGETLDTSSTPELLDTLLPHWTRLAGPSVHQLELLVAALEATWRVLPNGRIWVGTESWPTAPAFEADVLSIDPRGGRGEIAAVEAYKLLPGQTYAERRVTWVEHRFLPDALRTSIFFEDA
jgi:hypothetical protein